MRGILAAALVWGMALPALAEEVTVFAAASLKTTLDAVAAKWQADTGNHVTISYAGSSQLAQQISAGAPADLFISAAENWMDVIETEGLVKPGTRRDLLGNRLVLIAHGKAVPQVAIGAETDLLAMLHDGKLAMALVESVPAGQYGKAALENLGLWQNIAPRVAQSDNVRSALMLVATGEAPMGVVYATDAVASDNVSVVGIFPETSHPAIRYPMALIAGPEKPAAEAFWQALLGPEAGEVFMADGFTLLGGKAQGQ